MSVLATVFAFKALMVGLILLAGVNYGRRRRGLPPVWAAVPRPALGAAAAVAVLLAALAAG